MAGVGLRMVWIWEGIGFGVGADGRRPMGLGGGECGLNLGGVGDV